MTTIRTPKATLVAAAERFEALLPPNPMTAKPMTEERIIALAERAAAGYQLWHPDDAKWGCGQ